MATETNVNKSSQRQVDKAGAKGVKKESLSAEDRKFIESFIGKFAEGGEISADDMDKFLKIFDAKSYNVAEGMPEDTVTYLSDLLNDPRMLERAQELERAGKIQRGLEMAVDFFNEGYNYYLAKEQQRVGREELASVQQAQVPGRVTAIPELEDALRRARELGDPSLALKTYRDAAERAQLGAIRAAQLGSRGQAGALGAQAQALHSQALQNASQLPVLAQEMKARGLAAETPLIGQKQAIELANREADLQLFPSLLNRQLLQEQMAGTTLQMGQQGAQNVISRTAQKIPSLVGNLYSDQYSDLPPGVSDLVRNYSSKLFNK